jgi:DNA (cytosine-5)-methyltransferase 1
MRTYRLCDLFSGIGGIRLGFHQTGRFRSVFNCEIDDDACETFEANFGENPKGDITKVDAASLPDFDILAGGFPCQSFSMAGKRLGFDDTRGTLFFDIERILAAKKPPAVFFENVKGLVTHDNGNTFKVIMNVLERLGYNPVCDIINAKNFGVPQNRERVYIVGLLSGTFGEFRWPDVGDDTRRLRHILEKGPVHAKYFLSVEYLDCLKRHRQRQEAKGHGFGYEIKIPDGIASAIVVGGMGRERNLVLDHNPPVGKALSRNSEAIRMLTPRECARLQGFPEEFKIVVGDRPAYKQFGNSVAVPVIRAIARQIVEVLDGSLPE